MERQEFLQILSDGVKQKYLKKIRSIDSDIKWTPDTLINLSVFIEEYVFKNASLFSDILPIKTLKNEVVISESTLERIFKSGEKDAQGKDYEIYSVEEPLRPVKRKTLDILSRFIGFKSWSEFLYQTNYITGIYYAVNDIVEKLVADDFNRFLKLPIMVGYATPQSNDPAKFAHLEYKSELLGGFLLNFAQTIGWGWTINNENNSSRVDIDEIQYQHIGETPCKYAIFHLNMTFYLAMHSQVTQEFIEDVIIKVSERVTGVEKNGRWVFKNLTMPLSVVWVKCSKMPHFNAHLSTVQLEDFDSTDS